MHRPPCFVLCDSTKGPQRRDQKLSALGGQGHRAISVSLCGYCLAKWSLPLPRRRKWVSGIRRSTYWKGSACPDLPRAPGPMAPGLACCVAQSTQNLKSHRVQVLISNSIRIQSLLSLP